MGRAPDPGMKTGCYFLSVVSLNTGGPPAGLGALTAAVVHVTPLSKGEWPHTS
jgi:hypothetical protein